MLFLVLQMREVKVRELGGMGVGLLSKQREGRGRVDYSQLV